MLCCKFKVVTVTKDMNCRLLKLSATNVKDGDNQDWSKWTPSGEFSITVTNEAAFPTIDAMNLGDLYLIEVKPFA